MRQDMRLTDNHHPVAGDITLVMAEHTVVFMSKYTLAMEDMRIKLGI